MSDLLIFGVGLAIFFVTVYGTVIAGGIRLTRRQLREEPRLAEPIDDDDLDSALMTKVEY